MSDAPHYQRAGAFVMDRAGRFGRVVQSGPLHYVVGWQGGSWETFAQFDPRHLRPKPAERWLREGDDPRPLADRIFNYLLWTVCRLARLLAARTA